MQTTVVYRHRRENLKKCSLRGLEGRVDFRFFTYPKDPLPDLSNYILLDLEAPPLTRADQAHGLFIIDATWRYADVMVRQIPHLPPIRRSIPSSIRTAYPRRQEDCSAPELGLASIEAIYVAYTILGYNTEGLLDLYHWKDAFLLKNRLFFENPGDISSVCSNII